MERELFAQRLREAATDARDFARTFVEEDLPDALLFAVRLNCSYDGNPLHADERVYPDESPPDAMSEVRECTEDQVVALLWRGGTVPEWVDLRVIAVRGSATVVEALCCGRFTANEALLYHREAGVGSGNSGRSVPETLAGSDATRSGPSRSAGST